MADLFKDITIYHLLWYFVLYSVLGWCLEVIFCSVNTGKFVNRGFLNGPMCPIYGFGGVILTTLLAPVSNILLLYVASVVLCSLLELVAGFLLKKLFHTSWWDYSDEPLNIGGYICLKFSLLWGIAGIVLMDGIHPLIQTLVALIPTVLGWVLLGIFYAGILLDVAVTVAAINKLNRELREITRITEALRGGSDKVAQALGNTAIAVAGRVEALDLPAKKEALQQKLEEGKQALEDNKQRRATEQEMRSAQTAEALRAQREKLLASTTRIRNRLMKAFPNAKNNRYADAFKAWRDGLGNSKNSDNKK